MSDPGPAVTVHLVDDGTGVGVCGGSVRSGVGAVVGAKVRVGAAEPAAGS